MIKPHYAWELEGLYAILQEKNPERFVNDIRTFIQWLQYADFYEAMVLSYGYKAEYEQMGWPVGQMPFIEKRDWRLTLKVVDCRYDVRRATKILDCFRILEMCRRKLSTLFEGSLWLQIRNLRKRCKVRKVVSRHDMLLTGQDIFAVAMHVYSKLNGWGTPEQFVEQLAQ